MAIPTKAQHDKFRDLVDKTADDILNTSDDLDGQYAEKKDAKIDNVIKKGDLETEVGPLRFGFRKAVEKALENKTNELRRK